MKWFIKNPIVLRLLSIKSLALVQPVVLINTFSVYWSKYEQTLAYWKIARDVYPNNPLLFLLGYIEHQTQTHLTLRKCRELEKPKAFYRCDLYNERGTTSLNH
tara:strand:- start:64 stop:372 length:309 start_codon:yes stop_codon:yes gene_type:complete